MKSVKVEDAIGMVLGHDLTKIVPDGFKGAAFRKGHIITDKDVQELKDMGKYHINVIELDEEKLHENEAALKIAVAAAGEGIYITEPVEGKVSLKAKSAGLLKINLEALYAINEVENVMMATRHGDTLVEKDAIAAGTRIIPLVIDRQSIEEVERICAKLGPIVSIKELVPLRTGVVVTGSEVFDGRINDRFGPPLVEKLRGYGAEPMGIKYAPDSQEEIGARIDEFLEEGAQLVIAAGGMSVDADDLTPSAIRSVADEVVTYGSPVLPGAMFMLAYSKGCPIVGLPACGMYFRITVLDIVLPRLMAGEKLSKRDIALLSHGGLCLGCEVCTYPVCPFGK